VPNGVYLILCRKGIQGVNVYKTRKNFKKALFEIKVETLVKHLHQLLYFILVELYFENVAYKVSGFSRGIKSHRSLTSIDSEFLEE